MSLSTPTQKKKKKKTSTIFVSTLVASDEDSHNITIPFNGLSIFMTEAPTLGLPSFCICLNIQM